MGIALGPDADRVDEKYYEAIRPGGLGERLLVKARERIYADFVRLCRPAADSTILDVGVSDVTDRGANVLERLYPHPERITGVGLGSAEGFKAAFPAVRYLRVEPGAALPFPDDSFDIATSNAVLEHLGSRDAQARFVAELGRVARRVFVSVPNRYFPVEHHTAIALLHFWRPAFVLACRLLGKPAWGEERNLILMSARALGALAAPSAEIGHTGLAAGPFSSNLFLYFEREPRPRPGPPRGR